MCFGAGTRGSARLLNHQGQSGRWLDPRLAAALLKENLKFTGEDSPMANLLLSVMGAFAQFERELIRERQREGIVLAKKRGAYRGRKRSLTTAQTAELLRRVANGESKTLLAREFGVTRDTVYQYMARAG